MYIEVTVHGTGMMITATTMTVAKAKSKATITDSGNISDSNNGVDNDGNGSHDDQCDSGNADGDKDNGSTDFDNNDEDVNEDDEGDGNNADNDCYFNLIMVITVFTFCYYKYSDQMVEKSLLSQNERIQLIKCKNKRSMSFDQFCFRQVPFRDVAKYGKSSASGRLLMESVSWERQLVIRKVWASQSSYRSRMSFCLNAPTDPLVDLRTLSPPEPFHEYDCVYPSFPLAVKIASLAPMKKNSCLVNLRNGHLMFHSAHLVSQGQMTNGRHSPCGRENAHQH